MSCIKAGTRYIRYDRSQNRYSLSFSFLPFFFSSLPFMAPAETKIIWCMLLIKRKVLDLGDRHATFSFLSLPFPSPQRVGINETRASATRATIEVVCVGKPFTPCFPLLFPPPPDKSSFYTYHYVL